MSDPVQDEMYSEASMSNACPVILIGRGGGGTRLLSELVCSLGVFMGNNLNRSADSVEWVKDIYPLAIESVSTGIENGSVRDMYWRERILKRAADILRLDGKTPSDLWGWKLPETTLATPQIMRCFPNAKFIHLVRDPINTCCRRSHMTSRLGNPIGNAALPAAYMYCGLSVETIEQNPAHIHNAASWAYQVNLTTTALGKGDVLDRTLLVKFEALCENPAASAIQIADFLDVELPNGESCLDIDEERLKAPEIDRLAADEVWKICGVVAARLGYQNHK